MDRPLDDRPFPPVPVILTAAAGALHLAAARAHLDVSLLLAAGFVAVALVQLALLALVRRRPDATAELLVFVNLAAVAAWGVSRTVGLPLVGTGVEPVGTADVVTVVLQLLAVVGVLLPAGAVAKVRPYTSSAMVASLAVVALAAPLVGHAHAPEHPHAAGGQEHATPATRPAGAEGHAPAIDREQAVVMKARMTGAVGSSSPLRAPAGEDGHGHAPHDGPAGVEGDGHPHE